MMAIATLAKNSPAPVLKMDDISGRLAGALE
jgi:hypothetical protein